MKNKKKLQLGSLSEKDKVYSRQLVQEGDCIKGITDNPLLATVLDVTDQRTSVALA